MFAQKQFAFAAVIMIIIIIIIVAIMTKHRAANQTRSRQLLGQACSVDVIKDLLEPIRDFFK